MPDPITLGTAAAFLAEHPLLAQGAASIGYNLFQGLFGGPSELEQLAAQQAAVGQSLIPQLQAQAAGQPTVATQAQMGQLQQASRKMGQSYAASAQRRGTAGTTPSAAQQGRLQAAEVQGMANIMGQSQIAAQQQLGGIFQQGVQTQSLVEQITGQKKEDFMSGMGTFLGWYRQNQQDEQGQEFMDVIKQFVANLMHDGGGGMPPGILTQGPAY